MKYKIYLIPLILLAVCVVIAFVTRSSFTDCSGNIGGFSFSGGTESLSGIMKSNKIIAADDLIKKADIILKCGFTGERKVTADALYSQITVTGVYKGSKKLMNREINVIESVDVIPKNRIINSVYGYIPIEKNNNYILLLKKRRFCKLKNQTDFEKSEYYVLTNSILGAYNITAKRTRTVNFNSTITLDSAESYDLITDNVGTLNAYMKFKNDIISYAKRQTAA